LNEKRVTTRDNFLYVLIFLLLTFLNNSSLGNEESELDASIVLLGYFSSFVIPVVGIIWSYICNGGSSGESFTERFFSIWWVTAYRFIPGYLVATIWPVIILKLCSIDISPDVAMPTWILYSMVMILMSLHVLFYLRIATHVKEVAQTT